MTAAGMLCHLEPSQCSGSYPALHELAEWLARYEHLDELRELVADHSQLPGRQSGLAATPGRANGLTGQRGLSADAGQRAPCGVNVEPLQPLMPVSGKPQTHLPAATTATTRSGSTC
jgi:hypothetical protein